MNYLEKYLKYKKKYFDLRTIVEKKSNASEINIIGGMECIHDRVFINYFETCWAIAVQTMITFGDVTSNNLEEIMNSFKVDDDFNHNIESKRCFIKRQIKKVQNDSELRQAFPHYIFRVAKITNLTKILESFIDHYYSKIFNIKKNFKYNLANIKKCDLVILKNFKKLFNLYDESNHGDIVEQYLIANILSTFFLGYNVSFTNYYENDFSNIEYNDETDIGIIIQIQNHFCCFFTCNGNLKYYNDNDQKMYDCDWKTKLTKLKKLNDNSLYIKNDSCPIFLNEQMYKIYKNKKNIFKVLTLTVVSKYNSSNSNNLDTEIHNIFNKTNLDKIKDSILQTKLGLMYYYGHSVTKNLDLAKKYFELAADQNNYIAQNYLGWMYMENKGIPIDYVLAKKYLELAVDQNYSYAQNNLGWMYYNGYGVKKDYVLAKKYFELAADQHNKLAIENLKAFYP